MSRVFDCFMYCDERDALDIRLNELDPVVDHFVLCEATSTFTNRRKPLHFLEHRESYARFLPKITHVVVDDFPPGLTSPQSMKFFQRNALSRGLFDCAPDDIIIISDVDEIPHPDAIRTFEGPVSGLRMRRFYRYLNLEDVSGPDSKTIRSVIGRCEYMTSPQQLRALGRTNHVLNRIVDTGGWHFSHLGHADWIMPSDESVWDLVPIDATYPRHVVRNRRRYERLVAQSAVGARPRPDTFASVYFEQARPEVLAIVPHDARRVLELGCATGKLAATLKQRQDCEITGIEFHAEAAKQASTRLDRVIVGDCETLDLSKVFQPAEFDCVIAADVLEHLRDPEGLLRRLQPFLNPEAAIVVSVPNVRHAGVLEAAVQGYWSYQKWGILDRTHLRFFTRREIDNMFARVGFEVEERRTVDDQSLAEWERLGRPLSPSFGALMVSGLDEQEIREFFVFQWLVRARSAVRPRIRVATTSAYEAGRSLAIDSMDLDGLAPRVTAATNIHAELARRNREQSYLVHQLMQRTRDYELLATNYGNLLTERDSAIRQLAAVLGSTSWRVTTPLRFMTNRRPILAPGLRRLLRGRPRTQRALRTAKEAANRVLRAPASIRLPTLTDPKVDGLAQSQPAVYSARPIEVDAPPDQIVHRDRRRLICMTHVLPYPPRAGNEYRIHHLLSWLAGQGWDILLLVHPVTDEPITSQQLADAAKHYSNLIVCESDGTLRYRLRDGGCMLERLLGRQPRRFAPLLAEGHDTRPGASTLLSRMQTVCPDVFIELLLHLETEFDPAAMLAEYVFMTRPFPLLRSGLLKLIDTHDVFSSIPAKVARYGVEDLYAVTPELESELLRRGDVLIAIQAEEADALRKLAPGRPVVNVGVDFSVVEPVPSPAAKPLILVVGSHNAMNMKGVNDFLRFAWPLVRKSVPEAELHVIGSVGKTLDPLVPGIRVLGTVDNLDAAYATARVIINPSVAGTGLKIKTLEALCHLRPIVLWPSGVEGLAPEVRDLCQVARDWYDFARRVISLATMDDSAQVLLTRKRELATRFAPETVYAPLEAALASACAPII